MLSENALKDLVENGPEIAVFILIYGFWTNVIISSRGMDDPDLPKDIWERTQRSNFQAMAQTYELIRSLTKYGLQEPISKGGDLSFEFWKWWRWWRAYYMKMTQEDLRLLTEAIDKKESVSSFRPIGHWK